MNAVRIDRDWLWFGAWALVGAGFGLSLAALLSVGLLIAPVTALATVWLVRRRGSVVGTPGLLAGPAVPLLVIAWLNRSGPGTVCGSTADGSECTEMWNPLPFLGLGLALLPAGVLIFVLTRRQARRGDVRQGPANRSAGPCAE